jgi:hypothetical protein
MGKRRLIVRLNRKQAMSVTRVSLGNKKLVYVIQAQKRLRYLWGRSRIAYIGTTKNGMARFATSAADKAEEVLGQHGVREMDVRLVICGSRRRVRTWLKLERALLLIFRERYGEVPICNKSGAKIRWTDEESYFSRKRLLSILDSLES